MTDSHQEDMRVNLSVIHTDLGHMKTTLSRLEGEMRSLSHSFKEEYVTQKEFAEVKKEHVTKEAFGPVRNIVYSLVGIVMSGFLLAIVAPVIRR